MKLKKLKDYKLEDLGILLFGIFLLICGFALETNQEPINLIFKGIFFILSMFFILPVIHEFKEEEIKEDEISQERQDN